MLMLSKIEAETLGGESNKYISRYNLRETYEQLDFEPEI